MGVPLLVEVGVEALPFLEEAEVEEGPLLLFQGVEEEEEVHPCQEEGVAVEVLHLLQGVVVEVVALIYLIESKCLNIWSNLIQGLALTCSPAAVVYWGKVRLVTV